MSRCGGEGEGSSERRGGGSPLDAQHTACTNASLSNLHGAFAPLTLTAPPLPSPFAQPSPSPLHRPHPLRSIAPTLSAPSQVLMLGALLMLLLAVSSHHIHAHHHMHAHTVQVLMLGALLMLLLAVMRIVRSPAYSTLSFGLHVVAAASVVAWLATAASLCGSTSGDAAAKVHEHWPTVEQVLPAKWYACTGSREQLFAAEATAALSIMTTLASADLGLVLLLVLLAFYARQPLQRTARIGAAPGAEAREGESWWFTPPPSKPRSQLPLLTEGDGDHAASRYDMPPSSPRAWGGGNAEAYDAGGRPTSRTSMISNIDGDGPAQLFLANASLLPRWASEHLPRLSCSAKTLLAILGLAGAYVAGMVFFDSTAAAAVPFGGRHRQTVTLALDLPTADEMLFHQINLLSVVNEFEHGLTQVLLSAEGDTDQVTHTCTCTYTYTHTHTRVHIHIHIHEATRTR